MKLVSENEFLMENKFIVGLLMSMLMACEYSASRSCSEFYYDYNAWQTITENETKIFVNENNESYEFDLIETYKSEAGEQKAKVSSLSDQIPENVVCRMNAYFIYESTDLGLDIILQFYQYDEFSQAVDEQNIFHEVIMNNHPESNFSNGHRFQIAPTYDIDGSDESFYTPNTHSYYDSLTVNSKTYYDVIQSEIDTNYVKEDNLFWKIIASRGTGLIYFEDKKGNKFSLKE